MSDVLANNVILQPSQSTKRMKVLVCEDDEMVLKMVEFKLQKEGYEVILASDGKEAVEKIKESNPDIIITDIMMPYLTGLEIVHQGRQHVANIDGDWRPDVCPSRQYDFLEATRADI